MNAVNQTDAEFGVRGAGVGPGHGGEGGGFPIGAGRGLLGLVVGAVGTLLVTMLILIAFAAGGAHDIGKNHAFLLIATLAQDMVFVITAYALTADGGRVSPATFGFRKFGPSAIGTMALAFGAYFVLSLVYNALVGPPCDKLPDDLGVKESTLLAVLAGVFVIGIAPLAEEFFFRGFLFQAIRESWGVWIAAPASGLIFGVAHFQPDKLVPLAILGTALAYVFHKTRSLWPCILLHALNNTVAFVVLLNGTSC
jgi:membrane protease YdiL (CAAX protease family)